MASAESYLWRVVSDVEPTQNQVDGAKRSHANLSNLLCTGQMANRILGHYLSGSYARDTAIRPVDDVDIIFVVDQTKWNSTFFSSLPSPSTILTSFAAAIRYRYPVSSVYGQRRSVRLQLNHLDIDVVPAVYRNPSGDQRQILIPDSDLDQWIFSAPLIHAEKATAVNKARNGKFKPLVKLLKAWNKSLPSTAQFKSFAIETMATRLFSNINFQSLEEGLLIFFDLIAYSGGRPTHFKWSENYGISLNWFSCEVLDTAGTGSNTVAGVDSERRQKFVSLAERGRDKVLTAKSAIFAADAEMSLRDALRM